MRILYGGGSCHARGIASSISTLLASIPHLRSISLSNIYLDGDTRLSPLSSPQGSAARINALTVDLDALEVNQNLSLLLGEFTYIEKLAISCRFRRRILDCPWLPTGFFAPERFCSAPSHRLEVHRLKLDVEHHLPYLVRCLRHRKIVGLQGVSVRCHSDEDVKALGALFDIAQTRPNEDAKLKELEIDAGEPSSFLLIPDSHSYCW